MLESDDGKIFTIDKIVVKNKKATVYTFKVADYHSYYVSDLNIWTHNSCKWQPGDPVDKNTSKGYPSWGTVKKRFWKNEAYSQSHS